ncbi:hypothetical protein XAP412_1120002 [Xanthomonas phaseoli pv. phaseoli]|uniref:Secreted protein n=1 Tax=Xanthomonas campestris pv. phaseoli TaxID=317013 RepID=A0AB38DVL6_XANCH|nr:hypothetical protein XAP412_1120002 [Xanthomonas phaseoli pv. phaseoli]SON76436.1 hypothetical protein XAP6984_1170002 [Xanthomonas phaseoli pv. phaseoli]SON80539.1 hypothetical protein XAP7430_1140002 [Xanthomonas phaseoli pv. phaseoli]SOO30899.1 hypothetical protein XAP6164_4900002 [Xanthomonas phaseoli pv. phaseoli]
MHSCILTVRQRYATMSSLSLSSYRYPRPGEQGVLATFSHLKVPPRVDLRDSGPHDHV